MPRAGQAWAWARFEKNQTSLAVRAWGRQPVASVVTVIATYRRPDLLGAAVESALDQTVEDHAVVVVDDGSGCPPTLPADERLFVFSLTRHCGVAGVVRNVGIAASCSKYLAFLDDDNYWTPDHLAVSLAAHDRGAQLTYTALERVGPDGTVHDVVSHPFNRRLLRERSLCDTSTMVIRRAEMVKFSRVPLQREEFPSEDWELAWRCSRYARAEHVPVVTVRYRLHDGSYFRDWRRVVARDDSAEPPTQRWAPTTLR